MGNMKYDQIVIKRRKGKRWK